jgi:hypothetical protein
MLPFVYTVKEQVRCVFLYKDLDEHTTVVCRHLRILFLLLYYS